MIADIPTVDLSEVGSATHPQMVAALGAGLERWGFVFVVGHGVNAGIVDAAYASARRVWQLPFEVKLGYERPDDGRQRGYTGFGVEHARDSAVPDLKEFWHVGRDLPFEHPLAGEIPANVLPAEVPEFGEATRRLFEAMEATSQQLLVLIAEHLGESARFFEPIVRDGNSVLRLIHYPDVGTPEPGAVRAAAHEDINLITLLVAATKPGLQLQTPDGRWLDVAAPPGSIVADTGDMMKLLTGGRLGATRHRVVNPEGADGGRMSMPFFVHPRPDAVLCHQDGLQVTAQSYFERRQLETGVLHDGRAYTEEW